MQNDVCGWLVQLQRNHYRLKQKKERKENMQGWTGWKHITIIYCEKPTQYTHTHTLVSTLRQLCISHSCVRSKYECGRWNGNINIITHSCASLEGIKSDVKELMVDGSSLSLFVFPPLNSTRRSHLQDRCFLDSNCCFGSALGAKIIHMKKNKLSSVMSGWNSCLQYSDGSTFSKTTIKY